MKTNFLNGIKKSFNFITNNNENNELEVFYIIEFIFCFGKGI